MELDKRRWYVAWFFLSLAILDKFRGRDRWEGHEERYRNGTNLCHFMRVILVWSPLVVALHLVVYGATFTVLTIMPMRLFGMSGYLSGLMALGLIALFIAAVALILAALGWLVDFFRDMRHERQLRREAVAQEAEPVEPAEPVEDRGPGFLEVVGAHLAAAKRQICPMIEFRR